MKTLIAALAFITAGCVQPKTAHDRAYAELLLSDCLGGKVTVSQALRNRCLEESAQFCSSVGLDKSCGSDGLWTQKRGAASW